MQPLLSLLLLLSLIPLALSTNLVTLEDANDDDNNLCVYTVYVRTGSILRGGTNSVISVTFAGSDGVSVPITNLVAWGGLMGPDHDYFERGNLDIFSGRGACLNTPPCWMNLTSDGSGAHHSWYCNYVEVTATGPHMGCSQQQFTVEQWLSKDVPPRKLDAVRDYCLKPEQHSEQEVGISSPRAVRAGGAVAA